MLIDDNDSRCQIEPVVDAYDNGEPKLGLKIVRKLLNGYIHIFIIGEGRDNDDLILNYSSTIDMKECIESIKIECSDYSTDAVRDAVRTILRLDKNVMKQKLFC